MPEFVKGKIFLAVLPDTEDYVAVRDTKQLAEKLAEQTDKLAIRGALDIPSYFPSWDEIRFAVAGREIPSEVMVWHVGTRLEQYSSLLEDGASVAMADAAPEGVYYYPNPDGSLMCTREFAAAATGLPIADAVTVDEGNGNEVSVKTSLRVLLNHEVPPKPEAV